METSTALIVTSQEQIVHNVTTRGIDVTADDKEFITGIPELPEEYRLILE